MTSHRLDHVPVPSGRDRDEWNRLLYTETPTPVPSTPVMPLMSRAEHRRASVSHMHETEWPLVTPTSSMAAVSAIFGIGIFLTFGMTGPLAVLIGHFAWAETSTGERGGHGLTVTGLLLGYLAITFWVVGIVFLSTIGRDIQFPQFPNSTH